MSLSKYKQGSPKSICITEQCLAATNNHHDLGKGQAEGKFRVWGRHQQEIEHAASPTDVTTSARVLSRKARWGHLQDKHGKKAQGETLRKQEQPGQYIYNL